METEREAQQSKMKAQLDVWSAQLDLLKARAAKAEAGAKVELHKAAGELQKLQESAKKQLGQLTAASAEGWKDVKTSLGDAWTKLSVAVEETLKKIG